MLNSENSTQRWPLARSSSLSSANAVLDERQIAIATAMFLKRHPLSLLSITIFLSSRGWIAAPSFGGSIVQERNERLLALRRNHAQAPLRMRQMPHCGLAEATSSLASFAWDA